MILSINDIQHNGTQYRVLLCCVCRYAECLDLFIIMLNVGMLSVFIDCLYANRKNAERCNAECLYSNCHCAECLYASHHYAECHCAVLLY